MSRKFSDRVAIVANLPPASRANTAFTSDVFDFSKYRKFAAILKSGVLPDAGTLQIAVYAVATNTNSGGTAITGKAFTAATFSGSGSAGSGGSNHQGIVEFSDTDAKAALATARYGYVVLTVGVTASLCDLTVLGIDARNEPASDNDLASVAEII